MFALNTELLPHQLEAVAWMHKQELLGHHGGILADCMGLGKTLTCISLVMQDENICANLVVCTKSLVMQWCEEIFKHSNLSMRDVLVFTNRCRISCENIRKFKFVLVTYDTLNSQNSTLHNITWNRIILDEAHYIRNRSSQRTTSILKLVGKYKWCVTGTPFNNSFQDVATLCEFVGAQPYNSLHWWKTNHENAEKMANWRRMFLLMRKKEILALPPLVSRTVVLNFDKEESDFYKSILRKAAQQYINAQESRNNHFGSRMHILNTMLSWMVRLRQMCNHPMLILGRSETRQYSKLSEATKRNPKYPSSICAKCYTRVQTLHGTSLDCGHMTCSLGCEGECQHCKHLQPWRQPSKQSSKIGALLTICDQVFDATVNGTDEPNKMVIFCTSTSAMDLIEYALTEKGISLVRFDGDVKTTRMRNNLVKKFADPTENIQIFLTSLQAGSLGLNLTVANHVVLFDAWYNPFVEQQAVDRINRIGQNRPTTVIRLHIANSIEDDIIRAQEEKIRQACFLLEGLQYDNHENSKPTDDDEVFAMVQDQKFTETDIRKIFLKAKSLFTLRLLPNIPIKSHPFESPSIKKITTVADFIQVCKKYSVSTTLPPRKKRRCQ